MAHSLPVRDDWQERFRHRRRRERLPAWRGTGLGWVLLHVLIGLVAVGFFQLLLVGGVLVSAGRNTEEIEDLVAALSLLAVLGGLTGWLLFVYARRRTMVRLGLFSLAVFPGLVAAITGGLALQPRA